MIKRFEQFLKINESVRLDKIDIGNEVYSNFLSLNGLDKSIHISRSDFYYIDNYGYLRDNIKIAEKLTPSVFIYINFEIRDELKQESIDDIKSIIKKIKRILKSKYRLDLETLIIDTNKFDIYENDNIYKCAFTDKEDPFDGLNIKHNVLHYNNEEIYSLMILLKNSYKTPISALDFAKFYELTDYFIESDDLYVKIGFDELVKIFDPYNDIENVREKIYNHIKTNINPNIRVEGDYLIVKFDPNILRDYDDPDVQYWGSSWGHDLRNRSLIDVIVDEFYEHPKIEN